ncbi:MAG: alpha/beta-hydrolase N-terminal domain-containing protein, partial [Planctomycetota bacterium]
MRRYPTSLSFGGLALATLMMAASLTPSLIPRPFYVQGILSGFAMAIGYGVGVAGFWFWAWLGLPFISDRWEKLFRVSCVGILICGTSISMWNASRWQNSVRSLMNMDEVNSAEPIGFLIITAIVAVSILTAARFLIALGSWISRRLQRYVPQKVSIAISVIVVTLIVNALTNEVVARGLLSLADGFSLAADQYIEHGISPPLGDDQCGGPESLVPWPSIGRQGKLFLTTGPTSE